MSLKNKTNIAFFAALITLGVIGWFSFQGNRSTKEKDHLVSHARDILEASELLRSHISGAAAARRAYTLWSESNQIDAFNLASKSAQADFATLRKLKADASEEVSSHLTQMEALMKARLSLLRRTRPSAEAIRRGTSELPARNKNKYISGYFRFFILDAYAWASQP